MEKNPSWQHNLKRERQVRGWSQEDVATRIGSEPKTVGRWERGLSFPSPYFQQRLVDLFGKDAEALGFIAEQGENLRHAPTDTSHLHSNQNPGGAPHIDNDGEGSVTVAWPPDLPDELYYPLPGRERDLHNLLAVLQDPQGALVIAIDGLGGLGKTALAIELTRRALHQGLFKGVMGDSAKHELFAGGEIVKVNEATLDFDALLDSIARQRGRWELTTLPREEKRAMISQLLRQQRYLVLVDNLETAENADALLARDRGNFQEAVQWIRESLVRLTDTGEVAMCAQCHHFLGEVAFLQGDLTQARAELETSLRLGQQIGSLRRVATTKRLLGDLARDEGNYEVAGQRYDEALEIASRLGDQPETGRLFLAQGELMIKLKQPQDAILLLSGALATYKEIGHAKGAAKAALPLLRLYLRQGQVWQALKVAVLALKMT